MTLSFDVVIAPVDIVHVRGRSLLIVTWEDRIVSEFPAAYLRGWCPCAICQGHGIEVRFRPHGEHIGIEGLFEMGAYAIGIRFSDDHDSGIFSWSWLRRISPESPPVGLKTGVFCGDTYSEPRSRIGAQLPHES